MIGPCRATRVFDLLCAGAALLFLIPVFVLVSLAILCTNGRPIFFRQVRVGQNARLFRVWKFRTMAAGIPGREITAAGDARVTPVGGILRRWKLDELPQLLNVLAGHMSLVGPRPEVPAYVDPQAPTWAAVLSARPGLTDLATLLYRNEELLLSTASDPETFYRNNVLPMKLQLSAKYLREKSFQHDLRILWLTLRSTISGRVLDADRIFPRTTGRWTNA